MDTIEQLPGSILDQDLYKFCMQQAVLQHYPSVDVEYGFINRDSLGTKFNQQAYSWLVTQISGMEKITAAPADLDYLRHQCPYLSEDYLKYLETFRFRPKSEIHAQLDSEGALHLTIKGNWAQVILYEVPLLALISESYYRFVDTQWDHQGQLEKIQAKGTRLRQAQCQFAEFGTRRRRDFSTQDIVVQGLTSTCQGTSNVYLARKYGLKPIGTVGHEWTMGVAALEGTYEMGNSLALRKWYQTFGSNLAVALTDTFGTRAFFANFDKELATEYVGVRHDSGDPLRFVEQVHRHYKQLGIDPGSKMVVFSDGLTIDKAIEIKQCCERWGLRSSFGIGTHFTNDFEGSRALNIVLKLLKCGGRGCVKLSDDAGKYTGQPEEVQYAQSVLNGSGLL